MNTQNSMPENLLQFVWQQKFLMQHSLVSTTGETIEIIKPGWLNRESGPDFFQAQLRIGGTHWVGNVEVHKRSSDWFRHGHQFDPAYANVILHIVWEEDEPVCRTNGERIPALELKWVIPDSMLQNYLKLMESSAPIPCAPVFSLPDPGLLQLFTTRLSLERLEEKVQRVNALLNDSKGDWENVFYRMLTRAFGRGTNALPFEMLGAQLPFKLLQTYREDTASLQALVLGTAGLLPMNSSEEYHRNLNRTFQFLKSKHGLSAQDVHLWKYRGHRPSGFPAIRLLQLCLLIQQKNLLKKALNCNSLEELLNGFSPASDQKVEVNGFIKTEGIPRYESIRIGRDQAESLLVNAVLPFLFSFGRQQQEEWRCEKAAEWLSHISPENNSVTREFSALGWKSKNASDTQGLLQLKRYYCRNHRCLECAIGNHLLSASSPLPAFSQTEI